MTPTISTTSPSTVTASGVVSRLCLVLLCAAYLQGGLDKAFDFPSAIAEMERFGLAPALPFALVAIIGEIGGSVLVITGYKRWLGAAYLGIFTIVATLVAGRFWEMTGPGRMMAENGFFEHLGLAGAFFLVAWIDFRTRVQDKY